MKASILAVAACAVVLGADGVGSLPIVNAAFEDSKTGVPPGWSLGSGDFRLVGGHGYYGTLGLAWDSSTPCSGMHSVATQRLTGWRKGVRYRYSVYVRAVNLECPSGFPYIGLNFGRGASAEVCDVRTEIPVYGIREYARYEGFVEKLPDDTKDLTIVLGVSKGTKGRVIFDNVDIAEVPEPSVSFICSNAYRAMADKGDVEFHAVVYPPCDPARSRATFSFVGASGKVVRRSAERFAPDSFSVRIDVAEMAFGTNSVGCELSFGGHVSQSSMAFARVSELPKRRVCIDRHGRCLVDGKPFYPLGMFAGGINAKVLETYTNSPFNCVMPFNPIDRAGLDACQASGVMAFGGRASVILGSYWGNRLKLDTQEKVEAFHRKEVMSLKDHPALLGWCVFDEPPASEAPARKRLCELYREWDPDHPMWGVHCRTDDLRDFMQTADVLGFDSYPIGYHGDKAEQVLDAPTIITRKGLELTFGAMPLWNAPQAYNWAWLKASWNPGAQFPTMAEMRSMNWQHVAAGANGVISFSFSSMYKQPEFQEVWNQTVAANEEIAKAVPVLLSVEPRPSVVPSDRKRLSCRTWVKDGKLHLLACNLTTKPISAYATLEYGVWKLEDRYMADGEVSVDGRKVKYDLPPMGVSFVRLAADDAGGRDFVPVTAEVRQFHGAPTLFVDGKPSTGLMHWNRIMAPEDVAVFRDAGVHLYSFMGTPMMRRAPGEKADYGEGGFFPLSELTPEYIDRTMEMIVANDPKAKVIVRFRLTTPVWWRREHPDDCVKMYDVSGRCFKSRPWATPGSHAWRQLTEKAMRETIDMIERKWGDVVVGYHPGMACCAENSYEWANGVADYSLVQLKAWGREPPDPEIYLSRGIGDTRRLLDPSKSDEREAVEFLRFQSERMADAVCFQARVVKDELRRLGRTKVCGAFYGYVAMPANECAQLTSGHHAHERVLSCPDIDFIAAPIDYAARQPGGASLAQLLPGSVRLHGKLYYAEEDTRLHCATEDVARVSADAVTSANILRRDFFDAWSHGGTVWWMDLFGFGWYRDRSFEPPLSEFAGFAEANLANRESVAQIAVFVSDRSVALERVAPVPLSNALVGLEMQEVAACGAPYDIYRIEDIPLLAQKGMLGVYKMAIVLNAHDINDSLRSEIRRSLCRDGRAVVFTGLPGFVRGQSASATNVTELTGIAVAEVRCRDSRTVEAFPEGRRISYGELRRSDPALVVNDPAATAEGWFVQGTDKRYNPSIATGVALATKDCGGWTSVLSTATVLPSDLIRRFAERAGVHVYSRHGDQVFAGKGWFAVAAKMPGRHVFHPRRPGAKPIEADMPRGGCRCFRD